MAGEVVDQCKKRKRQPRGIFSGEGKKRVNFWGATEKDDKKMKRDRRGWKHEKYSAARGRIFLEMYGGLVLMKNPYRGISRLPAVTSRNFRMLRGRQRQESAPKIEGNRFVHSAETVSLFLPWEHIGKHRTAFQRSFTPEDLIGGNKDIFPGSPTIETSFSRYLVHAESVLETYIFFKKDSSYLGYFFYFRYLSWN